MAVSYKVRCSACGHETDLELDLPADFQGSHKLGCRKCKGMYALVKTEGMIDPSNPNSPHKSYNN